MGEVFPKYEGQIRLGHGGGLGNRLDVIATILLVSADGPEPEILWPINEHMPVHFSELFTRLPRGRIIEAPTDSNVDRELARLQHALPRLFRDDSAYGATLRSILDLTVDHVKTEVEAFLARHFAVDPPVGVHVRRVEKGGIISPFAQPSRYYEAVMRSCPQATRFFLCTDSREAFEWFHRRFGKRVFERTKATGGRSNLAGVCEGLIDILLLSRCRYIIGTDQSTFAAMAAFVGGIRLCRVRPRPKTPKSWPHFNHIRWWWSYRHFACESTFWRRWWRYESSVPAFVWRLRQKLNFMARWMKGKKKARG